MEQKKIDRISELTRISRERELTEDEQKERYREEWLHLLPAMVFAQHYMTFEEFYNTCTGANIDNRPVDEIIAEIDRKHAEAREETNGNGNL